MKYIKPEWPAPQNIKAYTTVRDGWGRSELNENEKLKSLLQLPHEPIWLQQIHGTTVVQATTKNIQPIADATYTNHPNRVCAVLTADCLPILMTNTEGTHVAAIHAGWRGLASGIIETTLKALKQPATDLLVWLGPAIGPEKFEVGEDVYAAFVDKHKESALGFTPQSEKKWHANLYVLAKIRLKQHGINHIFGGNFCTFTQESLFFSYRRDKNKTGRMASLIWIDEI